MSVRNCPAAAIPLIGAWPRTRRAQRYDEVGATDDDATEDDALDDLGPWRSLKVPFTAFRDRDFYRRSEVISVVYLLLGGETPGP